MALDLTYSSARVRREAANLIEYFKTNCVKESLHTQAYESGFEVRYALVGRTYLSDDEFLTVYADKYVSDTERLMYELFVLYSIADPQES